MIAPALLEHTDLLRGLDAPARALLASQGIERRYRTGQVLFRAGDAPRGWFVVIEGRIRVTRETVGRRHVIHVEAAGGTLGEVPLFSDTNYPATAIAAEPSRCLVFTGDTVRAALAADSALALRLLARLAGRVRGLIERMDGLVFGTVRSRLAQFIGQRAERSSGAGVSLGMTQRQLGDELGTVREVVVKGLASLAGAGVIRLAGGGRVEVLDRAALTTIARGDQAPARAKTGRKRAGR
jgi:CRP/FNR family transcriptional regulator